MIGPYTNTNNYKPYTFIPNQQFYGPQNPIFPSTAKQSQTTQQLPPQETDHSDCKKAIKKTAIYSTAFGAFGIWILNAIFDKK